MTRSSPDWTGVYRRTPPSLPMRPPPLVPPPRPPAPEGCIGPGFDPLTSWAPEDATATVIVTNDEDRGPGSLREALANAEDGDVVGFDA